MTYYTLKSSSERIILRPLSCIHLVIKQRCKIYVKLIDNLCTLTNAISCGLWQLCCARYCNVIYPDSVKVQFEDQIEPYSLFGKFLLQSPDWISSLLLTVSGTYTRLFLQLCCYLLNCQFCLNSNTFLPLCFVHIKSLGIIFTSFII